MRTNNGHSSELSELMEALCDDRMSQTQADRLEELVLSSRESRQFYLEYIDLHGTLHWDTALSGGGDQGLPVADAAGETGKSQIATVQAGPPRGVDRATSDGGATVTSRGQIRWSAATALLLAASILVGLGLIVRQQFFPTHNGANVADNANLQSPGNLEGSVADSGNGSTPEKTVSHGPRVSKNDRSRAVVRRPLSPQRNNDRDGSSVIIAEQPVAAPVPPLVARVETDPPPAGRQSLTSPVEFIEQQVTAGWTLAGVEPSTRADDGEWIRRVFLDITGRIPSVDVVDRFLKDRRRQKRQILIDQLLDDPAYVVNWTTIWTNLLIGRADTSEDVSRPALGRFLRRSFAQNRPWSEIVFDLVSAEGDNEENGAANFLLSHLNNEAVPATAVTARLFLGTQMQCTQCHRHPSNDWTQNQFWELNSCFHQTEVVHGQTTDLLTGKPKRTTRLVSQPVGGPVFYRNRQNVMLAVLPKFSGVAIDPGADTNRRLQLARLIVAGDEPLVAFAMVNRMWQHFFGYGFTHPIDDMGPHNQATHPALLDRLAREFVASGYDLKQLIRWICNSRPYQLTSRFNASNTLDDPAAGEPPLFSRMYVKSMTVEQLYDSLLVATQVDKSQAARWDDIERRRRQWLQQFVVAFETEENDETTTFDGTLQQALMIMNGQLTQAAVNAEPGTQMHRVITGRGTEAEKIRTLFAAALSRYPTSRELVSYRKLLRQQVTAARGNKRPVRVAQAEGLQDLFWAFLNSSEFILVH